jgi:hypothetical protein
MSVMIIRTGGSFAFPSMLLDFNVNKSLAATAYLIRRQGGSDTMFFLLKKLYYADRSSLICWGNTITGDEMASMEKGPILSRIYDLMKGKNNADRVHLALWDDAMSRRGNTITVRAYPDEGFLSEREKEVLEHSRLTINGIKGQLVSDWLHDNCPEWENPGKSSIPIDPSEILRLANKTEEQIRNTELANEELRTLSRLMGSR